MSKEYQKNQVKTQSEINTEQNVPQIQRNKVMQGQNPPLFKNQEQFASKNRAIRLKNAAIGVKNSSRFWGDSYTMKQVKAQIDRLDELHGRYISDETDFTTLKIAAEDIYLELMRVSRIYINLRKKRGKSGKDQTERYKRVVDLYNCASEGFRQIAGMTENDFRECFKDREEFSFGSLLEKDAEDRILDPDREKELEDKEKYDVCARNHAGLHVFEEYFTSTDPRSAIATALNNYREQRKKYLPSDEAGFNSAKAELSAVCGRIREEIKRMIDHGALLEKNKEKRDYVSRLDRQMKWEQKVLSEASFDENNNGIKTWDAIWEGDRAVIKVSDAGSDTLEAFRMEEELELKKNFFEKNDDGKRSDELAPECAELQANKNSHGSMATAMMAHFLGVDNLFASHKEVTMVYDLSNTGLNKIQKNIQNNNKGKNKGRNAVPKNVHRGRVEKGYISIEKGVTLTEAVNAAREEEINLIYSTNAIKQMSVIKIMDVICGQVNRNEDSLKVVVQNQYIEGEEYLVIESVMAVKNEYSFGTAKFDDVNKDSEYSSLTEFFSESKRSVLLGLYDPDFADRVMALNVDDLVEKFSTTDLTIGQINALKDRLLGVQNALRADKENPKSYRGRAEKKKKNASEKEKKAIDKEYESLFETRFQIRDFKSYINPVLIKDAGHTKEMIKPEPEIAEDKKDYIFKTGYWDLDSANAYVDDTLNSVKARKRRTKDIAELVMGDKTLVNGISRDSVHYKLTRMLMQYAAFEVTAEKAAQMKEEGYKMDEIVNNLQGFEVEEPFRSALLRMNVLTGIQSLEGYMVRKMKKMTYDALKGVKDKTEKEQLKKYLNLFSDCSGLLKAPDRIHADEEGWTLLDCDDKEIENFRDAEKEALFPHPPCIQDLIQGSLGNCYMIASLAAVVENDPKFILEHMRDEGKTVVVKLYKNKKPFYVRVKKTVPADEKGNSLYAKGALWTAMYEKAIMLSGLMVDPSNNEAVRKFKGLSDLAQRTYSQIESRNVVVMLPILTGRSADVFYTHPQINNGGGDATLRDGDPRQLLKNGRLVYKEMFNPVHSAIEITKEIRAAVKAHKVIAASTRTKFIQNTGERPGGREALERGFYSKHGYTVTGIEKKNGISYVRLRNPWGHGTVEEIRNPLTGKISFRATKDRYGTFVIDMQRFVTYFSCITTGSLPKRK